MLVANYVIMTYRAGNIKQYWNYVLYYISVYIFVTSVFTLVSGWYTYIQYLKVYGTTFLNNVKIVFKYLLIYLFSK